MKPKAETIKAGKSAVCSWGLIIVYCARTRNKVRVQLSWIPLAFHTANFQAAGELCEAVFQSFSSRLHIVTSIGFGFAASRDDGSSAHSVISAFSLRMVRCQRNRNYLKELQTREFSCRMSESVQSRCGMLLLCLQS